MLLGTAMRVSDSRQRWTSWKVTFYFISAQNWPESQKQMDGRLTKVAVNGDQQQQAYNTSWNLSSMRHSMV